MIEPVALPIVESSQVGEARRIAIALGSQLGFNETERGKVGLVVTEFAHNLVRHSQEGQLLLQPKIKHNIKGIEILSLDKGPGIRNISECLRDGFSTAGTSGTGLGAINRLCAFFDIYSVVNVGTACVAQMWASPLPTNQPNEQIESGVVCLPKTGEEVSGDAWAINPGAERCLFMVADGLGHGIQASKASRAAVSIFEANLGKSPKEMIEMAHGALRSTRGAALGIAKVDFENLTVDFAGVGNISGTIISPEHSNNMVSHHGTVGHEMRKIREFVYQWHKEGLLIMHSDGLSTHWRLDSYPGLASRHPSLIAGVLYRDFHRVRDDVTVLVARQRI